MERERKKAIRAAYRRVREAKRKKEPEVNLIKCLKLFGGNNAIIGKNKYTHADSTKSDDDDDDDDDDFF